MRLRKIYYIILFSMFSTVVFSAEESAPDVVTKVATCAANWLKLETGTRPIAMGGAYTAAGNDISGIPYNPASLAFIENQAVFLSQVPWPDPEQRPTSRAPQTAE